MKRVFSLMRPVQLRNKVMKKAVCFLLFFANIAIADPSINDQLNALDNAQSQARARSDARFEAEQNARFQEQLRQEKLAAEQRESNRRLEEKRIQQQAEANRAAAMNAKIAAEKAAEQARIVNEERLRDKARKQAQEDEEREYVKRQSELEIQQNQLEVQRLKAKADLEMAIANDRIKSVDAETDLARKKEATEIDVIQSGADVDRAVAYGVQSNLEGTGNEGLYKFLVVLFLIILVIIIVVLVFVWRHYARQKALSTVEKQEPQDIEKKPK